ncbi:MAG: oligosaccharide flippase family protein [Nanoarchaeota archaeon]|mgnify:CR=1 FL=1
MERIKKLIKHLKKDAVFANSFWLMANTIVLTGFGFLFWTLVARYYTPHEVGLASTLISSMNLIVAISGLGLGVTIVRFLRTSKDPNKNLNTIFGISVLLGLVISSAFVVLIGIFSPKLSFVQHNIFFGMIFVLSVVSTLIFTFLDSVFLSYDLPKYSVAKATVFSIVKIALPVAFVAFGVFGIFGSWVVGTLAGVILGIILLMRKKLYMPKLAIHENLLFEILPFSFGNYLAGLIKMLPALLFPLLITEFLSPASTAYYYTALMIAGLLYVIPNAMSSALLAEGSKNPASYYSALKKTALTTLALLIPSTIVLYVLSPFLMGLLGTDYALHGTIILRIFIAGSILVAINFFYGTKLNIEKKVGTLVIRNVIVVVVTFGSWYFLFLPYGLAGVGFAWMAGLASITPLFLYEILRRK